MLVLKLNHAREMVFGELYLLGLLVNKSRFFFIQTTDESIVWTESVNPFNAIDLGFGISNIFFESLYIA